MSSETEVEDEDDSFDPETIRQQADRLDFEPVGDQDHVSNVEAASACGRNAVEPADSASVEFIARQHGNISMSQLEDILQAGYIPREFTADDGDAAVILRPMSPRAIQNLIGAIADGAVVAAEAEPEMPHDILLVAEGGVNGGDTDFGEDGTVALFIPDDDLEIDLLVDGDFRVEGNRPDPDVVGGDAGGGPWEAERVYYINTDELDELRRED